MAELVKESSHLYFVLVDQSQLARGGVALAMIDRDWALINQEATGVAELIRCFANGLWRGVELLLVLAARKLAPAFPGRYEGRAVSRCLVSGLVFQALSAVEAWLRDRDQ